MKARIQVFGLFQVLHPVKKLAYKLELPKKCKIHDVFQMSLLEQVNTKIKQIKNNVMQLDFEVGNNEEYKVEDIWDGIVYVRESDGHLPRFYYLVSWKSYFENESTWKLASVIQHLWKLIKIFHIKYLGKFRATSPPVNTALPMAKPTFKPTKQKHGQTTQTTKTTKRIKKSWASAFPYCYQFFSLTFPSRFSSSVFYWVKRFFTNTLSTIFYFSSSVSH